jgi:8-oxo-dGTP pyrophosphatase MutT (NUDIX family)/thymidylate kinase
MRPKESPLSREEENIPRKERIRQLETQARRLRDLKQSVRPRRPILIEFCGAPKSGKTTTISSLQTFLKRNGIKTLVLTERASICPIVDKYDPSFNYWTVTAAIAEMTEALERNPSDLDVVIADRGIFDSLCWFTWLRTNKKISQDDFDATIGFLTAPRFRFALDVILVFTADPRESLKREHANLLTDKRGSIMNEQVLADYRGAVEEARAAYERLFRPLEVFDTTGIPPDEVNYMVTKHVLESLRELLEERVAVLRRVDVERVAEGKVVIDPMEIVDLPMQESNRGRAEDSEDLVQPVPVAVFLTRDASEMLVLKKRKDSTSEASPERGKNLVYAGGHIRYDDFLTADSADMLSTSARSLAREVKEELGIAIAVDDLPVLAIWDRTNPRSERHVALVYLIRLDDHEKRLRMDGHEFARPSGSSRSGRFWPIGDVLAEASTASFEPWSRTILETLVDRNFVEGGIQGSLEPTR